MIFIKLGIGLHNCSTQCARTHRRLTLAIIEICIHEISRVIDVKIKGPDGGQWKNPEYDNNNEDPIELHETKYATYRSNGARPNQLVLNHPSFLFGEIASLA